VLSYVSVRSAIPVLDVMLTGNLIFLGEFQAVYPLMLILLFTHCHNTIFSLSTEKSANIPLMALSVRHLLETTSKSPQV
jgi:hypothetical protein